MKTIFLLSMLTLWNMIPLPTEAEQNPIGNTGAFQTNEFRRSPRRGYTPALAATSGGTSRSRKIFIHAGVNTGVDTEDFLKRNPDFVPYLFEPNPVFRDRLQRLASRYGGHLYQRAVWILDDQLLSFRVNRNIWKNGIGGSLFDPTVTPKWSKMNVGKGGRVKLGTADTLSVPETFQVKTIDLSKFIKQTFHPNDEILLRLDVEGAEYEIFRKFIVDGTICMFSRVEYEAHAMFSQSNYKFKPFDAIIPWILAACNTEVEIEAVHLSERGMPSNIFPTESLSECQKCGMPPINGSESEVVQTKPGWWIFTPNGQLPYR